MDIKFSIIVPIYQSENYLEKCLSSILNQTYSNYEVIMVNDGSKDHSDKIMNSFSKKDKRFLPFFKENGGLSDARNYGVKRANGDYLLFLDADDYLELNALEIISSHLKTSPDLLKYHFQYVINGEVKEGKLPPVIDLKGEDALIYFIENQCDYEMAWLYAYKKDFFLKNHFEYSKGKTHEDFGLTPLIIKKADRVIAISDVLLNYVQRDGSIIHEVSPEKMKKRAYDMLYFYDKYHSFHFETKEKQIIWYSYLSNTMILWYQRLPKEFKKEFGKELLKRNVAAYIPSNTIPRFLKKLWIKIQLKG